MDPTSYKLFIKDLSRFEKHGEDWEFSFDEDSPKIIVNQFHIQGTVKKIAGEENEILIVNDTTGNAKVTIVSEVPGDLTWIKEGVYCSIIGTLIKEGKLPHVQAVKLAKIDDNILKEMWPLEVDDLKNFLCTKTTFDIHSARYFPIT